MLPTNKIKKLAILFLFICICIESRAQQKTFGYCDTSLVFRVYANNTILIKCDTAYVMNKNLYQFLYQSNEDYKEYYSSANALLLKNDSLRQVLTDEVILSHKTYQQMYEKYKTLDSTSKTLVDTFTTGLTSIHNDLIVANDNIKDAKKEIDNAKNDIKKSFKLSDLAKLAWGGGGFVVGVLTTLIVKAAH